MFSHKDFLRLIASDRPRELEDLWRKKTGTDPGYSAETIARQNKREGVLWIAVFCPTVIAWILLMFILGNSPLMMFGLFITVLESTIFLSLILERWPKHHTDAEWNFPGYYSEFLDLTGLTPNGVAMRDINDLRHIAKDILIKTAKQVRTAEKQALRNGSGWLRNQLKHRHHVFEKLSLVKEGYDYFYAEANRQIAEEEKAKENVTLATAD